MDFSNEINVRTTTSLSVLNLAVVPIYVRYIYV